MTRTSNNKKGKKLKLFLFIAIAALTVGTVWAATSGALTINGTAKYVPNKVVFADVNGDINGNGTTKGAGTEVLEFDFTFTEVGQVNAQSVSFTLENRSVNDVLITSISFAFSGGGIPKTTYDYALEYDESDITVISGLNDLEPLDIILIGAVGTTYDKSEEFEIFVWWVTETEATATITVTIGWAIV